MPFLLDVHACDDIWLFEDASVHCAAMCALGPLRILHCLHGISLWAQLQKFW